jgi:uncharacterized membrane protein YdjX (TVP38/TMEM64 family)
MAFGVIPTSLLALASGYFLGIKAVMPILLTYWVASWIGYQVASWVDRGAMRAFLSKNSATQFWMTKLESQQKWLIFWLRISPAVPFVMGNWLFSMARCPIPLFLSIGFVGMLPRTVLLLAVGAQAQVIREALDGGQVGYAQWLMIGLLISSLIGMGYVLKKIKF